MTAGHAPRELDVGGRRLAIGHLDRVIFPRSGTTKAELLDYYVRIAPVLLAHLRDRLLHLHRYPEGVDGPRFWQKACPDHRPPWLPTAPVWSRDKQETIDFCVANELAAVVWAVNIGSIELHTSLHTRHDLHRPTAMAFDLDPGEGVDVLGCAEVALELHELLGAGGLDSVVKTSGSKGLQVYVPLDGRLGYDVVKPMARRVAEAMEKRRPDRVVSRMARALRAGRVLIDWQQNTEHKSMVCAYSVRAKARPTVSTPVAWGELTAALDAGDPARLVFQPAEVLERVARHGDLFAAAAAPDQATNTGVWTGDLS